MVFASATWRFSPMAKATMAAAALSGVSNILAQFFETYQDQKPWTFDVAMFLCFILVTLVLTPLNYKWQQFLEKSLPGYEHSAQLPFSLPDVENQAQAGAGWYGKNDQKPKLDLRNTMTKIFIDCTLGAVFNTVAFFLLMGLFKWDSAYRIWYSIRQETIGVIVAGFRIWPIASIISFSCVPVERRTVFLKFVDLVWGIYMSLVATRV